MMGKKGGKKSVQSRFKGKTKDEISDMMRKVRITKAEHSEFTQGVEQMVKGMRKTIR